MFSAAEEKERQQLFAQAVRGMSRRLGAADESATLFQALRWGMAELDRTYAATPARIRATVACRAGCGHCCSVPVDVQAHEVFFAAQHIQLHFSPEALADVIARAGVHRREVTPLSGEERSARMQPCVLLQESSCSIYEGRPEACRAYHASDASVCAASGHQSEFEAVQIPALRARMFAVMLGLDEAIEAAGFDDRAYDFGSALHEALTDSLCLARWMRRQPAFSEACLADRA
jgi:Fe-S-cluster containining protein